LEVTRNSKLLSYNSYVTGYMSADHLIHTFFRRTVARYAQKKGTTKPKTKYKMPTCYQARQETNQKAHNGADGAAHNKQNLRRLARVGNVPAKMATGCTNFNVKSNR
jgi:hypothetical protein